MTPVRPILPGSATSPPSRPHIRAGAAREWPHNQQTRFALAASKRDAPVNKATQIHGAAGNTLGFGGSSASPNGNGKNGGNGIHNIAGGAPGQGGVNEPDDRPAGNMHGGLAGATGYSK